MSSDFSSPVFSGSLALIAAWQGPHQVFQKSTSTTLPLQGATMASKSLSGATSGVSSIFTLPSSAASSLRTLA